MSIGEKAVASQSSKKRNRAMVFWCFLLISFPLGALLIGYASGYRFQGTTSSLIQTSALRIMTKPKRALVYLDGKIQEQRTPYLENAIAPGFIAVTLEKEGHLPWKKNLRFEAGKSHVFGNVLLFRKSNPVSVPEPEGVTPQPAFHTLSDQQRDALQTQGVAHADDFQLLDGHALLLVDEKHAVAFIVPHIDAWKDRIAVDGKIAAAEWLDDRLLVMTAQEGWIYHYDERVLELLVRQDDAILDARWHPDGYYIFYSSEQEVVAMEFDNRDVRQRWVLATMPNATKLSFSKDGDRLFMRSQDKWLSLALY